MRQTLRPYTKIYTVAAGSEATIELKDTSGVLINCNYLSVEAVAGVDTDGYIHVEPSSVYANDIDLSSTSGTAGATGAGGITFQTGGGPIELSVADYDCFNAVTIKAFEQNADLILNYGIIKHQNPLRDNERFGGE